MSYLANVTIAKKKKIYYLWVWPVSVLTCLNFDLPEGNTQIIEAGDAGKRRVKKSLYTYRNAVQLGCLPVS